ncbi:ion transporter [Turneriella parva]|uniref:Ion transport protein n=1 Tax=Turneriella parva (strain ATCC BAA-1111 / DSM 21527 / NCTC 11395 / H) TaxID=869212 RepID=I4B896_TURPD|nr:ion transporter [Turneriella parva]AFM13503.1 Ion transport protein [Turneriella parva DSM 21527]
MKILKRIRNAAWWLCEDTTKPVARIFNVTMMLLILASILSWLLDTDKDLSARFGHIFRLVENVAMVAFVAEYLLRLIAFDGNVIRFIFKPFSIIDALAILPYFLTGSGDTAVLRILRLFRIFRIVKLARYSEALHRLVEVFKMNRSVLAAFVFVIFVILVLSASLMHTLEPERFGQMSDALWWSIVTLTTVGYGDIVPATVTGKIIAGILMIFGIGIIALPTGVLGASMTKLMLEAKTRNQIVCNRCGEQNHYADSRFCHRCGERVQKISESSSAAMQNSEATSKDL